MSGGGEQYGFQLVYNRLDEEDRIPLARFPNDVFMQFNNVAIRVTVNPMTNEVRIRAVAPVRVWEIASDQEKMRKKHQRRGPDVDDSAYLRRKT